MKTPKKVLSVILAVMMILSIISLTASATTYSGTCGENLTWSFDDSTGTLTILGTGVMDDYGYGSRPWEAYREDMRTVVIDDGVTTIGYDAFYDCDSLTSVTIGDSVKTIGVSAFAYCSSLTSVTIPDSVTTIGDSAFLGCNSLTSVTIPDSVTTIGDSAFLGCNSLTSVTIPDSVTTIGEEAFYNCDGLTSITVDSNNQYYSSDGYGVLFNKDKTTLIRYPAGNTRTSYTIPDGVTTIGNGAFYLCESLTSVTIPDSVTIIGDFAFYGCDSLESVTIGNSTTIIGDYAFYGCDRLTSITIPDSVTTIGDSAFKWCNSLTDVYYSGTEANWNAISIDNTNNCNAPLFNATIHFNYNSHTHEYSEWTVVTEPTCTETGLKTRTCECGDVKSEEISAIGHDYKSTVTAPSCTEKGYTTHTCANCNDTYVDNYVDATGHKYNEVVTQSTCEQNGYTACICECGDSYISNIIAPTGHADDDKDGYCDICDELLCDHDCHRGDFAGFLWKITNFFNKLFRTKQYCECGVAHY